MSDERKVSRHFERADVTPIFKKRNDNEKENYCSVSMLPTFSKVFEKLLFEQINDHVISQSILQVSAKTTVLEMIY